MNPLIIIQARIGSTRLPGKVMREIDGLPLIKIQLDRLRDSMFDIVVATPNLSEDLKIINYVDSLGYKTFMGDETNVLKRFYDASKFFGAKDIIRITGDNPFIDGEFIKTQISLISPNTRCYYLSEGLNKQLPLGTSFEMFSFELLEEAFLKAESIEEKEHVTPYMWQNLSGDVEMIEMSLKFDASDMRLTVDTESDFELANRLIQDFQAHNLGIKEIIDLLRLNDRLLNINRQEVQIKVPNLKK